MHKKGNIDNLKHYITPSTLEFTECFVKLIDEEYVTDKNNNKNR